MTPQRFAIVLVMCLAASTTPTLAETPPDDKGRYSLSPANDGFVRLDRETGAMTFCEKKDDAWQCDPMADSTETLRKELDRLKAENEALKADTKHLEEMLGMTSPAPAEPGAPGAAPKGPMKVPTEEDVDKLFDYVEGMVRKFKERIERLEKEADKDQTL